MTTRTITVGDLATELGTTVRAISTHVSQLCRAQGPNNIVHTAQSSNARTTLHHTAANTIRARYTNTVTEA